MPSGVSWRSGGAITPALLMSRSSGPLQLATEATTEHGRRIEPADTDAALPVAAAMIDRLVHRAEVIALKGDSYRLKNHDLGRPQPDRRSAMTTSTGSVLQQSYRGPFSSCCRRLRPTPGRARSVKRPIAGQWPISYRGGCRVLSLYRHEPQPNRRDTPVASSQRVIGPELVSWLWRPVVLPGEIQMSTYRVAQVAAPDGRLEVVEREVPRPGPVMYGSPWRPAGSATAMRSS